LRAPPLRPAPARGDFVPALSSSRSVASPRVFGASPSQPASRSLREAFAQ
jgi:hypothetical protein